MRKINKLALITITAMALPLSALAISPAIGIDKGNDPCNLIYNMTGTWGPQDTCFDLPAPGSTSNGSKLITKESGLCTYTSQGTPIQLSYCSNPKYPMAITSTTFPPSTTPSFNLPLGQIITSDVKNFNISVTIGNCSIYIDQANINKFRGHYYNCINGQFIQESPSN